MVRDTTGAPHFAKDPLFAPNSAALFNLVAPAWSVGVELSFYLVAPFIVRRRWWVMAALIAASFCIRLAIWRIGQIPASRDPFTYRFFPSELGTFLMGSAGYYFYRHAQQHKWALRPAGWIAWIVMLVAYFAVPALPLSGLRPVIFIVLVARRAVDLRAVEELAI